MCLNLWIILTPPPPWHLLENLLSAKKLFFQLQPAPTIFCLARVCLDGAGGLTALGTQHRWSRGRAGQEVKPQHLSRQQWALWHITAQPSTVPALKKPWDTLSWDQTGSRTLTEATTQREFLIGLQLPDIRGVLRVLVLLEKSCIQH